MQLKVISGATAGKIFILDQGTNLIGRWDQGAAAFPEVDLEQEDVEAKVSRKHAAIHLIDGKAWVEDLDSLNGTFLNDSSNQLKSGTRLELKPGDQIIIGQVILQYEK